jgi:stearoyl-CoA desaturase (delta-9 desaturase)
VKSEIIPIPRHGLNRATTIALILFHIGAIWALFFFSWKMVAITALLYWMSTGLGISLGYHRLHTHRSYVVPRPLEYFFAVCGALTLEGGPISWVATHRIHHQFSDKPGDPHSPHDGAFWSHVGWLIWGETMHNNTRAMSKYAPDLARYPFYIWLNNYHWAPVVVMTAILLALGGWPLFLWGVCMRVVFGWHATWCINSITHMWGERRFNTRDDSRNNFFIALFTFGEGWHNNHHAHPTSARHGLAWWEFDMSWITLKMLRFFGIATNIRVAKVTTEIAEREAA